jgi:hypothetical protein
MKQLDEALPPHLAKPKCSRLPLCPTLILGPPHEDADVAAVLPGNSGIQQVDWFGHHDCWIEDSSHADESQFFWLIKCSNHWRVKSLELPPGTFRPTNLDLDDGDALDFAALSFEKKSVRLTVASTPSVEEVKPLAEERVNELRLEPSLRLLFISEASLLSTTGSSTCFVVRALRKTDS